MELGVPDHVLNSIIVSRLKDDTASLRKVIEWWFKNTPNPEWNDIQQLTKGTVVLEGPVKKNAGGGPVS